MKKAAILCLFLGAFTLQAQETSRFFIETEYQVKFSVGKPSYQSFQLIQNLEVYLPYVATYGYPVSSLNVNLHHGFTQHFSAGLGVGFGFVKYEPIPLNPSSYYDKLLVPLYLRVRYSLPLKNNWSVLAEVDGGYQFTGSRWDYIKDAGDFRVEENGGATVGVTFGIGKSLKKYTPTFKIGYEFNQFQRKYVYKFTDNWLPTVYQTVEIYTYYNLVKVGLALKF